MVVWAGHRAACTASRHQWPSAVLHVDHLAVQAPHAEMAGQWQSSETPRPTCPLTEGTSCVHCVGLGWLVKSCWTRAGLGHKSALSFFDWSASWKATWATAGRRHMCIWIFRQAAPAALAQPTQLQSGALAVVFPCVPAIVVWPIAPLHSSPHPSLHYNQPSWFPERCTLGWQR